MDLALWSTNLLDTDKTIQAFFKGCAEAGPSKCPFYAPSPEEISHNLLSLYDTIRTHPIPVRTEKSYGVVDYSRLRQTLFHSLFSPHDLFQPLAQGLADLAAGNGTSLYQIFEQQSFECQCDDGSPEDMSSQQMGEPAIAIHCNDGEPVPDSLAEAQSFFNEMMVSSEWAEVFVGARLTCM